MDKSEILVHISAPSGVADDARYRAQVEAILNFQAVSREAITVSPNQPAPSAQPWEAAETISPRPSPPRIPASARPGPAPKRYGNQKDSLETPVSVIPDSQPEQPGPAFDAEELSLIPELPDDSPHRSSKRPRVDSPPLIDHLQDDVEDDVASLGNIGSKSTDSIVDTFLGPACKQQAPIEPESGPGQEPEQDPDPFSLPLEIKPPAPPISTSPFTTHITPTLKMLTKRLKSPRTYNPTIQTRDLDTLERGYWFFRINLVSSPETGAIKNDVDPTTWDKPLFNRFWTFLSDFISKEGRAGWGVWCILEAAEAEASTNRGWDKRGKIGLPNPVSANAFGVGQSVSLDLKVYAWGEIACHVYLLLFLASERRVRKMGAQWRDGGDEVVIQMPGP